MYRFAAALIASLALAAPAFADGPIATADPNAAPPTSSDTPAPLPADHGGGGAAAAPQTVMGPCGPDKLGQDGKPQHDATGEVDAGIDSHGYHQVSGTVCKPVGDNGGYVEVGAGTGGGGGSGWGGGPTRRP